MAVEVTSMMASVSACSPGSGTVSTLTLRLPCQVTARMSHHSQKVSRLSRRARSRA